MSGNPWDVAIIGGGIIGTSIAFWLGKLYNSRIAVIEKEREVARHTSRRNTGIIHRPFYINPKEGYTSAKAAQISYDMWKSYAAKRKLPWLQTGTFDVAVAEDQVGNLHKYFEWGLKNGMSEKELEVLSLEEVAMHEPNVRCHGAIWSKTDTSVDYEALTLSLKTDAQKEGVKFLTSTNVKSIVAAGDFLKIHTENSQEPLVAKFLINCAGGNSMKMAHMLGVCKQYADLNFRGEYWQVHDDWSHMASRNIYSIPRYPELPFLDPHWIVRADGRREIGPNAVPVIGPFTYEGILGNPIEAVKKLAEPPIYNKVAVLFNRDFINLASHEWMSSISKQAMINRIKKFLPQIKSAHIYKKGAAGIRSVAVGRKGSFVKEIIEESGFNSHHVTNYKSPGATGAPAYSARTVRKLEKMGCLEHLRPKPRKSRGIWDFDAVCDLLESR